MIFFGLEIYHSEYKKSAMIFFWKCPPPPSDPLQKSTHFTNVSRPLKGFFTFTFNGSDWHPKYKLRYHVAAILENDPFLSEICNSSWRIFRWRIPLIQWCSRSKLNKSRPLAACSWQTSTSLCCHCFTLMLKAQILEETIQTLCYWLEIRQNMISSSVKAEEGRSIQCFEFQKCQ